MACNSCKTSNCTGCKKSSISLPATLNMGAAGSPGDDGASSFVYIAYATSNTGADFSITPFNGATYLSIKSFSTTQTNDVNIHSGNWALFLQLVTDGDIGAAGIDGVGIANIAQTAGDGSPNTVDTYTITYTDSSTSTFNSTNGANGNDGSSLTGSEILYGATAPLSGTGEDGDTYIDTLTSNMYSKSAGEWTLQVNIKGTTGDTGIQGTAGVTNADLTDVVNRVDALNLVDNTADVDKPVSTAAQAESDTKQDTLVDGSNISTLNGISLLNGTPLVIGRGAVEIPVLSYANRASLRTPVLPIPSAGDILNIPHLGHFQYSTAFEFIDDDEMVFEAVDPADGLNPGNPIGQWVLTIPSYEWTEVQKMFSNAVLLEWMEDEELRFNTY
jgi:hypothetical protein